jgi:hypothetical protein
MVLTKTYKKYLKVSALIWTVCLAAFVLFYLFIFSPQNKTHKDIEKKIIQGKQEYEQAQRAAKSEIQASMNEEIGLLQNKLENFVLDSKSAADLTFDISQMAKECSLSSFNVQSSDMQVAASSEPNSIFEKHIKVSFVAGFNEFAVFLNSLERHKPVLFVNEFILSRQNNDKTTYQVILDLAALVQKPPAKIQDKNTERMVGLDI